MIVQRLIHEILLHGPGLLYDVFLIVAIGISLLIGRVYEHRYMVDHLPEIMSAKVRKAEHEARVWKDQVRILLKKSEEYKVVIRGCENLISNARERGDLE
jgi:hypothetical protein